MSDIDLESSGGGMLAGCPDCECRDFLIEELNGDTVFRCLGCAVGWLYALGYVWRLDQAAVPSSSARRL